VNVTQVRKVREEEEEFVVFVSDSARMREAIDEALAPANSEIFCELLETP
jgi:hypothetical protein